jgi:hypothetical protein
MLQLTTCTRCGFHGILDSSCPVCSGEAAVSTGLASSRPAAGYSHNPPLVEGWVASVRPLRSEPRDFSWWRFGLLVCAVLIGLSFGLVVIAVLLVLALLFGWSFGIGHLIMLMLFQRRGADRLHQVTEFFVQTPEGHEYTAVVKGKKLHGAVEPGHRVALWGGVRNGIIRVSQGYNYTTASEFGAAGY